MGLAMYSVDRIEGEYAVLVGDSGPELPVLLAELPEGVREGNVLRLEDGVYRTDATEEQHRRSQILSLQDKLRRKN